MGHRSQQGCYVWCPVWVRTGGESSRRRAVQRNCAELRAEEARHRAWKAAVMMGLNPECTRRVAAEARQVLALRGNPRVDLIELAPAARRVHDARRSPPRADPEF